MKYNEYKLLNSNEKINYFIDTLSLTNRTPEYYVNWDKVIKNTRKYELELNTLNYLIGKENIKEEARMLFTKQPELLKAIPSLIACRENNLNVLLINEDNIEIKNVDFHNIDTENLDKYVKFMENQVYYLSCKIVQTKI